MPDYSRFRNTCLYCFADLEGRLVLCACHSSFCKKHIGLHCSKTGCTPLATIHRTSSGVLEVSSEDQELDTEELTQALAEHLKTTETGLKRCKHSEEIVCSKKYLSGDELCTGCSLKEDLWVCVSCGRAGCGREQPNSKGRGHALKHFEESGHPFSVKMKDIMDNNAMEAHCYRCDSYVINPCMSSIMVKKERENDIENEASDGASEEQSSKEALPYVGIANEGQTCYISSTLQLLAKVFSARNSNLEEHFTICELNPLECFCCQFVKVMAKLSERAAGRVRANDFFELIYTEMTMFGRGIQQDCSEFIVMLLQRLSFYEEAGLLPKVTDAFAFKVANKRECTKCEIRHNEITKETILYTMFSKSILDSLKNYFAETSTACQCGGEIIMRMTVEEPPEYLLLVIKRHNIKDGTITKISDPIKVQDIPKDVLSRSTEGQYALLGAVCHAGSTLVCGHYTCWILAGGKCFMISDSSVSRSTMNEAENGVVFLYGTAGKNAE